MVGREPLPDIPKQSWTRYFRFTLDHKVVGIQYLVGVFTFLFTGGLLAMAIRTELLTPTSHFFGPGTYIDHRRRARHDHDDDGLVGRRRAARQLPRPTHDREPPHRVPPGRGRLVLGVRAGYFVILTALPLGGFPTGWTGYAPLQTQGCRGHGLVPDRLRA